MYDQSIAAIYIILLALLNDITMIMVAYDNVVPSKMPETPTVTGLLTLSMFLGITMMAFSLMFYILGFDLLTIKYTNDHLYRETVLYLQVSLSIELLIFNCREPERWFWSSNP